MNVSPLLKKGGVIIIIIGIILAVIIVKQYLGSINTVNKVSNNVMKSCNTSGDCVYCNGKCISYSVSPSFCQNPVHGKCVCENGSCEKI